jgi:hypothetical protein
MEAAARTRVVAAGVILAAAIPLGVVAAAGSGGGEEPADTGMRVERSTEMPEMLIYLDDDEVNNPERTGGRRTVRVECLDTDGLVVASQAESWPMTETDAGTLSPHAHVPVNPARIADVESCRVVGTKPLLEAEVL